MKTYTIAPASVPEDFVHFVKVLIAQELPVEYLQYFLDVCRTFMNAIDSDDEYFLVKHDGVLFEKDCVPENLEGSTWVETLTGDDMSAVIYSKDFARMYLNNIDFRGAHHVVVRAMYPKYKTNKCAIDSFGLIDVKKYLGPPMNEYTFMQGYQASGLKFSDIMSDYETMSRMKKSVEDNFFEKYGMPINIKDYKYIKNTFETLKNKIINNP